MAILSSFLIKQSSSLFRSRFYSSMTDRRGLVLGVYTSEGNDDISLTPYAKKYNESTSGELLKQISIGGPIKGGSSRVFWGIGPFPAVAVAGLGDAASWSELDEINGVKENVRIAAAAGTKALLSEKITNISVEDLNCAKSAAEGAVLGAFKYQGQKFPAKRSPTATISLADGANGLNEWNAGFILANTQNWSRTLMDTPANLMTPTIFAQNVKEKMIPLGVAVDAHNREWAEQQGMGAYLSVARGSAEPPIFLEITYNGSSGDQKPICLVGKGITFDSGGISIKPASKMDEMRGDMGGAAVVAGTIAALAELKVPVNVKGLIPLTENMPSGTATKPGDVVFAMNGKSICVDNTDAEGRLVLVDAICYSEKFNPKYVLDIATLTGAIRVALGDCVAGAFCSRNELWSHLHRAGSESGDRMWRMPLFKHYTSQMTEYDSYDVNNVGKNAGGGSCTAAAFIREFVPKDVPWIHVDMAGIMGNCTDQTYTGTKGMTGRPMRTLVEFVCSEAGLRSK
ncbi:cytosol aminopeptidase-like isoform X2 [Bradysia coprophila]|uniref:cytosol aminopeptidase-like isoform X2 n=1 Tax=Bradysia coprophila TaxID=38358 RepID=UPI00187DC272|nr:cytosol aminopeptidase-like isoform X2 [Bradysia coprophila]